MKLTDWRGNEYGVGTRVIYARSSGRSVEMQEGTVTKIVEVDGKPHVSVQPSGRGSRNFGRVTSKMIYRDETGKVRSSKAYYKDVWKENPEPRRGWREPYQHWIEDKERAAKWTVETVAVPLKETTLTVTQNITVIGD